MAYGGLDTLPLLLLCWLSVVALVVSAGGFGCKRPDHGDWWGQWLAVRGTRTRVQAGGDSGRVRHTAEQCRERKRAVQEPGEGDGRGRGRLWRVGSA